jgi:hypothetical protein
MGRAGCVIFTILDKLDELGDPSCEIRCNATSSQANAMAGHKHIVAELAGCRRTDTQHWVARVNPQDSSRDAVLRPTGGVYV